MGGRRIPGEVLKKARAAVKDAQPSRASASRPPSAPEQPSPSPAATKRGQVREKIVASLKRLHPMD